MGGTWNFLLYKDHFDVFEMIFVQMENSAQM